MFRTGVFGDPESEAFRPLAEIQARESVLPAEDELLVEITRTGEGDHCCVFAFEGRLVNAGLGALLALRLSRRRSASFSVSANDYGVELFTPTEFDFATHVGPDLFSRGQILEDSLTTVNESELMKTQFREIARVSGMVLQTYPGARKSGRQVGASSSLLFDVLREFDPDNLLLEQARREVLERQFERSRLSRTFDRISQSRLVVRHTARPTPLSFPILIERLATRLSSESIQDRIERMKAQWAESELRHPETDSSPSKSKRRAGTKTSSSRRSGPPTGLGEAL
jgi:ATP-dependent Lhr-like helicase